MSLEHPKNIKVLLHSPDGMRFDVEHRGNKNKRHKSLVTLLNLPAVRASGISAKLLQNIQ